tara:strand:+ start:854 stop:1213 length:360 start_codon:yes stop_codon:yes gene_type:complete
MTMGGLEDLDPKTVAEQLKAGEIILIDVREPREYGHERIHGALLHPLSTLEPSSMPVDGKRRVVLHCAAGRRSAMAAMRCQDAGFNVDAHMAGGLGAWKAAGLPIIEIDPETGNIVSPG